MSANSQEDYISRYLWRRTARAPARIRRMTKLGAELKVRTNRIGRHLPTSGGFKKTLRTAREQGLETVQIFVSNPQELATVSTPAVPTLTLVTVR